MKLEYVRIKGQYVAIGGKDSFRTSGTAGINFTKNVSVAVTSAQIYSQVMPFDLYITEIAVLPLNPSYTVTFWLNYGIYKIGSSAAPLQIVNVAFDTSFNTPFPLVHMGESVTINGYASAATSVTVLITGVLA